MNDRRHTPFPGELPTLRRIRWMMQGLHRRERPNVPDDLRQALEPAGMALPGHDGGRPLNDPPGGRYQFEHLLAG